ncbi:MAG: DNA polymerase III subunit chi [Gammaproteobacteria bacterium]|nr:DNA polymerase III subunit chi [Gammaproteobacteria bacterium]
MPKIDFYVTKNTSPQFALRTACRIAEKAHQAGLRVHIQTRNDSDTQTLDTLLWTFRDRSFIPHEIYPTSAVTCPVTIGTENGPAEAEILINTSDQVPENTKNYQRIAEIIDHQTESIHAGRERYRFYREQGFEPQHHEVSSS